MASTTPKLDRIISEFGRRIGDEPTYSSGILAAGTILTAAEFTAYVNKAMMKLFNDAWIKAGGNAKAFLQVFPELYTTASVTATSGVYTITNPNAHLYYLIDAYISGGAFITVLPSGDYNKVMSGINSLYVASSTYPKAFHFMGQVASTPLAVNTVIAKNFSYTNSTKTVTHASDHGLTAADVGKYIGVYDVTNGKIGHGKIATVTTSPAPTTFTIDFAIGGDLTSGNCKVAILGVYGYGSVIKFEPAASFASQAVTIGYIKAPLSSTDGSFLTQGNGDTDSPFLDHWNSVIAEIAEQMFRADSQNIG